MSRLKEVREARGLTHAAVARATYTTGGNLSRIENRLQECKAGLANRLVKFFEGELTLDDLDYTSERLRKIHQAAA